MDSGINIDCENPTELMPDELALEKTIFLEKLNILYKNLWMSIPGSLVCATLAFIGIYHEQHSNIAIAWIGAMVVISVLRIILYRLHIKRPGNETHAYYFFIFGMCASALLWGIIFLLIPIENNQPALDMLIIVVIAGVASGGAQTLTVSCISALLYISIILIPLCIWVFMHQTFNYVLLGIAMTTYLLFMISASFKGCHLLNKTLRLSHENDRMLALLNNLSIHDPVTLLYNRRFLDELLQRELLRVIREQRSLCVCMIDIDCFKNFNDTYGHEAGDLVLKLIAKTFEQWIRHSDVAARYGGMSLSW